MRRVLPWLLGLIGVIGVLFCWVVGSQRGLLFAFDALRANLPEGSLITANAVRGKLVGPLIIEGLEFHTANASGSIHRLEINWEPRHFLGGELLVSEVALHQPQVNILDAAAEQETKQETSAAEHAPVGLPEEVIAPVSIRISKLRLVDASVTANGREYADLQLTADGRWVDSQLDLNVTEASAPWGNLAAAATLRMADAYPLRLNGDLRARVDDFQPLAATFAVNGPLLDPKVQVQVEAPYGVTLDAECKDLAHAPSVAGSLSAMPASLYVISPDLPELTPSLQASIRGPLNALVIAGALDLKGVDVPELRAEYAARISNTQIQIDRFDTVFSEQGGALSAQGRIGLSESMPVEMNVTADWLKPVVADSVYEFSELALTLSGSSDGYSFRADTGLGRVGRAGTISIEGEIEASDAPHVLASVSGKDLLADWFVPDLAGTLNTSFGIDLHRDPTEQWVTSIKGMQIDGDLAEQDISVQGQAKLQGSSGSVESFELVWGNNRADLHGEFGAAHRLQAALQFNNLKQLEAVLGRPLRGTLRADAQLLGSAKNPQISLVVSGSSLRVDQTEISAVSVSVEGQADQHSIEGRLSAPHTELELKGMGALTRNQSWKYLLTQLQLGHREQVWQLEQASAGQLSAAGVGIERTCLMQREAGKAAGKGTGNDAGRDKQGRICVEGSNSPKDGVSGKLSLQDVQLAGFNALLPSATQLIGEVGGTLEFGQRLQDATGLLRLNGVGLLVRQADEWAPALRFAPGEVSLLPVDDDLRLDVTLPLYDPADGTGLNWTGTLDTSASNTLENSAVASTLTLGVTRLDWLERFVSGFNDFSGELRSALELGGTLGAPKLSGTSTLDINQATLEAADIQLRKSQLTMSGVGERVRLQGVLRSGEGEVALDGELDLSGAYDFSGTVVGSDFLVSDSAEARVVVSPDLSARYRDGALTLGGKVVVPVAELVLEKLPEGAVTVSPDQRFDQSEENDVPFELKADVGIELGDRVSFEGLGLKARFGGKLTVSERSTGPTTGRGEIVIKEGSYQAYGQDLRVQNGKVIFAGGPIDEPGLDVKAVRQATPEVQVGVHVLGSLQNPQLEVFSTPALPQSDQLAYLVLGRPLSESSASENTLLQQAAMAIGVEGGTLLTDKLGKNLGVDRIGIESAPGTDNSQAALVVGKYLSPRLYVSYGYGLFEPISTLRLEYQLNALWRIVTESTNEATGGDLIWVLER